MIRTALVSAVAAAAVAAGWGCTQSPGSLAGKTTGATARLAQLEDELNTLKVAQLRQAEETASTLASLKAERERSAKLLRERDELQAGLATRLAERDAARAKLDGFRQELRELLTRVEGGGSTPSPSAFGSAGF